MAMNGLSATVSKAAWLLRLPEEREWPRAIAPEAGCWGLRPGSLKKVRPWTSSPTPCASVSSTPST